MKKKALAMVFAALMVFTTAVSAGSEAKTIEVILNPVTLLVNEETYEGDFFEYNGETYVPLSLLKETKGISVETSPKGSVVYLNSLISDSSESSVESEALQEITEDNFRESMTFAYDVMSINLIEEYMPHYQALGYLMYDVIISAHCKNYELAVLFYEECLDMFNLQYDIYIDSFNELYYETSVESDFAIEVISYTNNRILKAAEEALTYLAKYINTVQRNSSDAKLYLDTFMTKYFTYNEEWSSAEELFVSLNIAYSYLTYDNSDSEKSLKELIIEKFWIYLDTVLGETWHKKYDKEKVKYEDYEFSTDKLPKVTYKQN